MTWLVKRLVDIIFEAPYSEPDISTAVRRNQRDSHLMQPTKTLVRVSSHALFVAVSSLKNIKRSLDASRPSFRGYQYCERIDRDRPTSTQISISSVARLVAGGKTRGFVQGLYENRIIVNIRRVRMRSTNTSTYAK
jgi:predicted ABC-type ATPase